MTGSDHSAWPWPRIAAWGVTAAVVFAIVGPTYVRSFLPPEGAYTDFLQEWLSARNYLSGEPIYRDVPASIGDHMPERRRPDGSIPNIAFTDPATGAVIAEMKYNAHPPVAVLVAIPFARLEYRPAHLAWNLVTFGLFLIAIGAVIRELAIPFPWPALFPAMILLVGNPVLNQVYQGQLNFLLAAIITAGWVADRRGRPALAGAAIGLAAAVKLYPLFLLVYFAFTRRWSGLMAGCAVFLAANGLAASLFGVGAYSSYAKDVVPAIAGQYEAAWVNMSLHGFWLRLMATDPVAEWFGSAAPNTGRILAWSASLAATALVAFVCMRAATRDERDRAFALAAVAMLLVSPITWSHYYLLLIVPLGLAWMRSTGWPAVCVFGAVLAVLWLPPNIAAQVWLGREAAVTFNEFQRPRLSTAEDMFLVSAPHYALVALFGLLAFLPGRRVADSESSAVDSSGGDA